MEAWDRSSQSVTSRDSTSEAAKCTNVTPFRWGTRSPFPPSPRERGEGLGANKRVTARRLEVHGTAAQRSLPSQIQTTLVTRGISPSDSTPVSHFIESSSFFLKRIDSIRSNIKGTECWILKKELSDFDGNKTLNGL